MLVNNLTDTQVVAFLTKNRPTLPAQLQEFFVTFQDLYERRLWHQLTLKVQEFLSAEGSAPFHLPVYENFIAAWENKMSQIALAEICIVISLRFPDHLAAAGFLEGITEKVKHDTQAYLLARTETANFKLLLGDLDTAKKILDENEESLNKLDGVDTVVHASFYRVLSQFWKLKGNFSDYYKNSLLYLACVTLEELPQDEILLRAHDLGIAALLSDTIFNFGELLMHPIVEQLASTEYDWLRSLLFAFNSGDIQQFEQLASNFSKEAVLQTNIQHLWEKIRIMSLVEAVSKRSADDRRITFQQIAQETRVAVDQVEHLLMRSMSLKLVRGSIDEVDQNVSVTWLQPRVLDRNQISGLRNRLNEWNVGVRKTTTFVEETAPELFAQQQ